jgi:hypothetical protein
VSAGLRLAAATAITVAAAGCGLGAGPASPGTATLTVTRDYGAQRIAFAKEDDPAASETVLRFLDRNSKITTRYGGGFVQSINGLSGAERDGRRYDWFFYVNGIESPIGSTQVRVRGGDRIWWDYRDWTSAMRVPAVVGSWPQPFSGAGGAGVKIDCAGAAAPCRTAHARLARAGVDARVVRGVGASAGPRLLVGPWAAIERDPAARQLLGGPASSGVFARFGRDGRLSLLETDGSVGQRARADTGLVAALRRGDGPPTWVVTAANAAGVERAAERLDAVDLTDHYAVAAFADAVVPVPLRPGGAA